MHKIENFLIRQFKHLFWVLKGTVSLRSVLLNTHNISFSLKKLFIKHTYLDFCEKNCSYNISMSLLNKFYFMLYVFILYASCLFYSLKFLYGFYNSSLCSS